MNNVRVVNDPFKARCIVTLNAKQLLHKNQYEVARDPARFKVMACGRRFGKTRYGVFEVTKRGLQGKRCWWIAPTYSITSIALRVAHHMAQQIPGAELKNRNGNPVIFYPGGGEVWFKSGDDPDKLRGEGLDYAVFDEFAYLNPKIWTDVIRPALADRKGDALFVSTPSEKNPMFHKLYDKGQPSHPTYSPIWKSWRFSSYDNPFIDPAEIDEARTEMSELVFQREFLAQFVSVEGARVRPEWLRIDPNPPDPSTVRMVMGCDLAISMKTTADFTVLVVIGFDPDSGRIWVYDAMQAHMSFFQTMEQIKRLDARWHPALIGIEENQYQAAMVQELLRTTPLPVVGVRSELDKVTRFEPIAVRYERGLVFHTPWLPEEFERNILGFPVLDHDDIPDAFSCAYSTLRYTEEKEIVVVYDDRVEIADYDD